MVGQEVPLARYTTITHRKTKRVELRWMQERRVVQESCGFFISTQFEVCWYAYQSEVDSTGFALRRVHEVQVATQVHCGFEVLKSRSQVLSAHQTQAFLFHQLVARTLLGGGHRKYVEGHRYERNKKLLL